MKENDDCAYILSNALGLVKHFYIELQDCVHRIWGPRVSYHRYDVVRRHQSKKATLPFLSLKICKGVTSTMSDIKVENFKVTLRRQMGPYHQR